MAVQYNLPSPSAPLGDYNDDPTPLTQPFLDASVNGAPLLEYISQTKARQQNRLRICRIPFSVLMLFSICWLTFGSYWVFDTPGAIENQLHNYFNDTAHIDYTKAMNLNLYSIYSWPNTVLAFFGGFIIDQITGIRMGALIFGALIAGGQVLFAIGIQYQLYWLCFAGRFVFGLGGESLTVAQNAYTVRWFDGPILALVFGLVVAFARVGSSINFVVTPQLANGPGVPFAVWFGAGMCGISLCFCIIALFLDLWGDRQITKQRAHVMSQLPPDAVLVAQQDDITENTDEINFVHNCFSRRCPTFFWNSIVKEFGIMAWLLFLITLFFYVSILAFYQVASDIMQKTGNKYSDTDASLFLAIPNFVAIVASPAFGYLVDKVGRALYWICTACCMFVCGHIVFVALAYEWIHIHPAYIMVWLGFGYSLGAASLWPILAYIIDKKLLGTAYGCMTAVQNTGLAVFPLIIGQLQDAHGIKDTTLMYTIPILIFIGCSGVAFAFTIVLMGIDRARGGKLNASATERARQVKEEEERVAAEQEQTRMDQEAQPKHVVMG